MFEVILHLIKNLRLHNVDILEKFLKRLGFKQKYVAEKMIFKFQDDLIYVTFNDL